MGFVLQLRIYDVYPEAMLPTSEVDLSVDPPDSVISSALLGVGAGGQGRRPYVDLDQAVRRDHGETIAVIDMPYVSAAYVPRQPAAFVVGTTYSAIAIASSHERPATSCS